MIDIFNVILAGLLVGEVVLLGVLITTAYDTIKSFEDFVYIDDEEQKNMEDSQNEN